MGFSGSYQSHTTNFKQANEGIVDINNTLNNVQQQITHFADDGVEKSIDIASYEDSTFQAANAADANLADFMARPLKIYETQVDVGSLIGVSILPWFQYFTNKRVINRMANYSHFRAKLCLKIVINGTPFHYGRILASYQPNFIDDRITGGLGERLVKRSQMPHLFLDPTEAVGGTMTLPFFYPEDGLPLYDFAPLSKMGILRLDSMADLTHANEGTDPITISVYAWAEALELCVPTSLNPTAIVPQAGPMQVPDEYGQGVVSKPASTIAHVAGMLSKAPSIGPYAMATQLAASAVGKIAALFGFSRPISLERIQYMKPKYTGDLACTDTPDTCEKLTVDSKQEVTIDPRVVGLSDVDELSISYLATRESYFQTFAVDATSPIDSKVFAIQVNPTLYRNVGDIVQPTALAFAVKPFEFWRGSMKLRFLIDAASMQKARLAFVYRPFQTPFGAEYETNLEYTYICDIQEKKDFTMDCGWTRNTNWLKTEELRQDTDYLTQDMNAATTIGDVDFCLGTVTVHVVNSVTGPGAVTTPIYIHCFVSGGDDFQVAKPLENPFQELFYLPQGGELSYEEQAGEIDASGANMNAQEGDMEHSEVEILMSKAVQHTDKSNLVFFGERITSMRQMLKRYNLHEIVPMPSNLLARVVRPFVPVYRGFSPNGLHVADAGGAFIPYNLTKMTLLNYLLPAYAGFRGSVRYKNFLQNVGNATTNNMRVIREVQDSSRAETNTVDFPGVNQGDSEIAGTIDNDYLSSSGTIVVPHSFNNVLEYELPWYSYKRFGFANDLEMNTPTDYNPLHMSEYAVRGSIKTTSSRYVSVGEDFSTYFFTGAPPYQRTTGFPGGIEPLRGDDKALLFPKRALSPPR